MTDEVQTTRYRNLENYPVFLQSVPPSDGEGEPQASPTVEAYGFADLSEDQVKANREAIDEHFVKVYDAEKEDTPSFDRKAALVRAKELGVERASNLTNDQLKSAIIEKEGDNS